MMKASGKQAIGRWIPCPAGRRTTVGGVSVLAGGESRFRDDDGSAEPSTAAALAAFGNGTGSEHAVLTALARARLLVPVVATASEDGGAPSRAAEPRAEKHSEMSLATLVGRDGRRAVPAFTCLDSLTRWRPGARPVPAAAEQVWRAAVADSCAVVVDVAGPVPLAVDGPRLAALASGQPVPLPHQDPDVLATVRAAAGARTSVTGFSLAPGSRGTDLEIRVSLAPGCAPAVASETLSQLGAAVMTQLGERLRRGVALAVVPQAGSPSVAP
jgi:SseB protein N-terminal domain